MWQINFLVPFEDLNAVVAAFEEDRVDSIYWKEEKPLEFWSVAVVFASPPDVKYWQNYLQRYCIAVGVDVPTLTVSEIPEKDWLRENQKIFAPFRVGSFYIYGSTYARNIPAGVFPLMIDASTAFGSGQHDTTQGCLKAMETLKTQYQFAPRSVLDIGCGSGILSMAAARLWGVPVKAIDLDPEAVDVATENCIQNGLDHLVSVELGDGAFLSNNTYDLIVANILADPLAKMAQPVTEASHKGTFLILSGLLTDQTIPVQKAYIDFDWALVEAKNYNDWSTLILQKTT